MTLVLRDFDYGKEDVIQPDLSDYLVVGVLSHQDEEGELHPVAYISKTHTPVKKIYDL